MVYCAQAWLAFSTAVRRDAVLADIQDRVAAKPRWGVSEAEAAWFRFGEHGIRMSMRFTARPDADDLLDRVEAFAVGQRAPLPGSTIQIHACPHDEDVGACPAPDSSRTW
jgi:hypothetical protein